MESTGRIQRISNQQIGRFKQVPGDNEVLKPKLDIALKLGHTFKSKCRLVFNTTLGRKTVYGTIWNVTEDRVELKGGTSLLISSIEDIKLV